MYFKNTKMLVNVEALSTTKQDGYLVRLAVCAVMAVEAGPKKGFSFSRHLHIFLITESPSTIGRLNTSEACLTIVDVQYAHVHLYLTIITKRFAYLLHRLCV